MKNYQGKGMPVKNGSKIRGEGRVTEPAASENKVYAAKKATVEECQLFYRLVLGLDEVLQVCNTMMHAFIDLLNELIER